MYVEINDATHAAIRDVDNLRELKVLTQGVPAEGTAAALAGAGLGSLDGEHAWLPVDALRAAGAGHGTTWEAGFEKMIAYAASKGWLSDDGLRVRAHLQHA